MRERDSVLEVGYFAGRQAPVVDEAAAPKRTREVTRLFRCRVKAILVGTLRHDVLLAFLVLNRAFDGFKSDSPCRSTEIAVGPHAGKLLLQMRELLSQLVTGGPFDGLHQPMNAKLWVTSHQQMNMVSHDLHFNKLLLPLLNTLLDECFQAGINPVHQHLAPILGAKDDVIVATVSMPLASHKTVDYARASYSPGAFHFFAQLYNCERGRFDSSKSPCA